MSFEWQTEEEREDVWEEEKETATAGGRASRRRRWLAALAVAALLMLAGLLARREAEQRVEEATAAVEEDVLSSHALGLQAAQSGDEELFVTILSGREPSWTETQKALLEAGLLYGDAARPFGLQAAGEGQVVDVAFAPDLRAAELQMSQRYTAAGAAGGEAEPVTLERTLVYREGQQRWLLAPPEADFWGSWANAPEEGLTVVYPERDEEVAVRLAADLSATLAEMCATVNGLECPAGWQMRLRLEKDPEILLALGEREAAVPTGAEVSLPAPSLVGVPADDDAYKALLRGYARHLVAAAIGDLVGWTCCEEGVLYYQALLHEQLAQLGLRPGPAPLRDYVYLVDEGVSDDALFNAASGYWNRSRPAPPGEDVPVVVHAFLAYLRDTVRAQPAVAMQRSLAQADAPSLARWVDPLAAPVGTLRGQLTVGFQAFARRQMERASEVMERPAELELPDQDLLLACGDGGGLDLYLYDVAAGSWSLEADLNAEYVQMAGDAPRGTVAVLAFSERGDEIAIQNVLWRPQGEAVWVAGAGVPGVDRVWLPLSYGPRGELTALIYSLPVEESEPAAGLVDLETCRPGGCDVESLPGLPLWSPSGDHVLALDIFQGEGVLHLRAAGDATWQRVGPGWAPLWLDDETYAYVPQTDRVRLGSLWAAPAAGGEGQRLVPTEELAGALPVELAGRQPTVSWAFVHPLDENQLLVTARERSRGGQLLFTVERTAAWTPWLEASLAVTFVDHFATAADIDWFGGWFSAQDVVSPDGRWLSLPADAPDASNGGLLLYDLAKREMALRSRAETTGGGFLGQIYDWSRDGAWLARPVAGVIDVLAPAYQVDDRPYRQLITHDFERCAQVVWVDDG